MLSHFFGFNKDNQAKQPASDPLFKETLEEKIGTYVEAISNFISAATTAEQHPKINSSPLFSFLRTKGEQEKDRESLPKYFDDKQQGYFQDTLNARNEVTKLDGLDVFTTKVSEWLLAHADKTMVNQANLDQPHADKEKTIKALQNNLQETVRASNNGLNWIIHGLIEARNDKTTDAELNHKARTAVAEDNLHNRYPLEYVGSLIKFIQNPDKKEALQDALDAPQKAKNAGVFLAGLKGEKYEETHNGIGSQWDSNVRKVIDSHVPKELIPSFTSLHDQIAQSNARSSSQDEILALRDKLGDAMQSFNWQHQDKQKEKADVTPGLWGTKVVNERLTPREIGGPN